jgi:adenosine deaminase
MEAFIAGLPKAELHMHLEGSLKVERMIKLAEKNKVPMLPVEQIQATRCFYEDFLQFVQEYDRNTSVIKDMQDLYEVCMDYLEQCASENIIYTEISFCPIPYISMGFTFGDVMNTLKRASEEGLTRLGVRSNFILIIVKHLAPQLNLDMIRDSAPFKDSIVAIGNAGVEIGHPARSFAYMYDECRKIGYKYFTGHSGEFGDPRCMIDTLYHLRVNRIDHGVRCLEDPYLVKFLRDSDIFLTVCPLSNYNLKVLEKFFDGEHIIQKLMENGLKITINSDDPTLLGGFLNDNYLAVAKSFTGKTDSEIKLILGKLAKDSFIASFIPEDLKSEYLRKVDEYLERSGL